MIGYDRLSTPADLASPQPNRAPKAAMDSSSYRAHADMLGARFGVRAAEDGHLTCLTGQGREGTSRLKFHRTVL